MNEAVKQFFATLHREHLKPRGYTKTRHNFTRKRENYTEVVQFQGSAWNDSNSPWVFYINFVVEFHDLPDLPPRENQELPLCWGRTPGLVSGAPAQHALPPDVPPAFVIEIADLVEHASNQLQKTIHQVRERYLSRSFPFYSPN